MSLPILISTIGSATRSFTVGGCEPNNFAMSAAIVPSLGFVETSRI